MLSIDTETTGVDFRHSCKPFFVTMCDDTGKQTWWEWDVNPITRQPIIPADDLNDIGDEIFGVVGDDEEGIHELILQNGKFDVTALSTVLPKFTWPWYRTQDTLIAAHLLDSSSKKSLDVLSDQYLKKDILQYEIRLKKACDAARRLARSRFPDWKIAKAGLEDLPSVKDKTWKADLWLPRAIAKKLEYDSKHEWWTVTRDYANIDSAATIELWPVMKKMIQRRGLWEIYLERMKVVPIAYRMEANGVTVNKTALRELRAEYADESHKLGNKCLNIASDYDYDLQLPKGASPNDSLRDFCFGPLDLPRIKCSKKTGNPSLDKFTIETYLATLPPHSMQMAFIRALKAKRSRDTAITYMAAYERFWVPWVPTQSSGTNLDDRSGWYVLHPSLNPTGTNTLRWSCSNPNEQNISKKEGFNLRRGFGPAPGREWYSMDAQNIELRIPSYKAPEPDLIKVFERPKDPPYFGSYHLVISDLLHPELFKKHGKDFKEVFESTWYQWVKNGNFAIIYGAQEETADRTYRVPGAYQKIRSRFPGIATLNDSTIEFAIKHGYVETFPDKSVNPNHGYPLMCTRNDWDQVLPTVPLNYKVQGTAMWWMQKAMIRCQAELDRWHKEKGFDGFITMQVHDELVFDFPKSRIPPTECMNDKGLRSRSRSNLWRVRILQELMQSCGDDLGIPTPVAIKYHDNNWAEGKKVC